MSNQLILVVDDDAFFRTFCSEVLRGEGHTVHAAGCGAEALELLANTHATLIVADIYMPEMTGLELLESIKARHPAVDVVIMTGYASIDTAVQALKSGAADYLPKPFDFEQMERVVMAARGAFPKQLNKELDDTVTRWQEGVESRSLHFELPEEKDTRERPVRRDFR